MKTNKNNKQALTGGNLNDREATDVAASASAYQGAGGLGNKQDSVMTVTIEGTVNNVPEQASVTDQLDQSHVSRSKNLSSVREPYCTHYPSI